MSIKVYLIMRIARKLGHSQVENERLEKMANHFSIVELRRIDRAVDRRAQAC